MPRPIKKGSRYMGGLDGLRALAVVGVILYHLKLDFLPGGFLGVGVFFVISGYLITNLMINEWKKGKGINFTNFLIRRGKRLLPALLTMVLITTGIVALFFSDRLPKLWGDALSSLLYYNNWYLIYHQVSYFEQFGPPSPFGHLWSLSVESQFYLLWPILFLFGLRWVKKKGLIFLYTLMYTLISFAAMAMLYTPGTDPSRVYYGTDTRAFSLLVGAALAVLWPSQELKESLKTGRRLFLEFLGLGGLVLILMMFFFTDQYDPSLYQGGMLILTVATTLLIASVAHPSTWVGKALGWMPLRWIGERSYGIYLWHYPIIALTSPTINTSGPNLGHAALQVLATVVVASLSWKYIEEPIRKGGLSTFWTSLKHIMVESPRLKYVLLRILIFPVIFILLMSLYALNLPGLGQVATTALPKEHETPVTDRPAEQNTNQQGSSLDVKARPEESEGKVTPPAKTPEGNESGGKPIVEANTPPVKKASVTAIGDSILIDIEPYLKKQVPGIVTDGKVGRQFTQAKDVIHQLKENDKLGNTLIIGLGTNGAFTEKQLSDLIKSFASVERIILVNVRVPKPWEKVVNKTLSKAAAQYPKVTLIDWYRASSGHDSYFASDGVHLTPAGAKYMASLIAASIPQEKKG